MLAKSNISKAMQRLRRLQRKVDADDRRKPKAKSHGAQPEGIAPDYVFLTSPHRSSYSTGEILPIVGGY